MNTKWAKISVTFIALAIAVIRLVWPDLKLDAITLGLLVLALLPWLQSLIKSAEFPGGWKIEFQDVQAAGQQIMGATPPASITDEHQPSYLSVADTDPNLAIVGLRIEIERRLRTLAQRHDLPENKPLITIIRDLSMKRILKGTVAQGLYELIKAGNNAAHGASVEHDAATWAIQSGPTILAYLDNLIGGTD